MKKSILFIFVGLFYLALVLLSPSFTLLNEKPGCGNYIIQQFNFGVILAKDYSFINLISMWFSVISGSLFFIGLFFHSHLLEIKQKFRLFFVPLVIFALYGFVVLNLYVFNIVSKVCYNISLGYIIYLIGAITFIIFGIYIAFENFKE